MTDLTPATLERLMKEALVEWSWDDQHRPESIVQAGAELAVISQRKLLTEVILPALDQMAEKLEANAMELRQRPTGLNVLEANRQDRRAEGLRAARTVLAKLVREI